MVFSRKCLLLVFVLMAASRSWAMITEKIEILTTATELSDYFAASAKEHPEALEVSLSPTAKWVVFGKFRGYTLKILPLEVTAENVAKEHYKHGSASIVESTTTKQVRFAVKLEKVSRSYVVAHFEGGLLQEAHFVEVCIPYTAFRQLLDKGQKPKAELVK